MANTYYKHIDGLRAIAVLSVFLYHLGFPAMTGGFVGVDIFFVISGYLITGIILRELQETGRFSFVAFYIRRAKRIFPALACTLLVSFCIGVWLLVPAKFTPFGGTLAAAAASVSNIFLLKQAGYFDIFSKSNPLLHTWSLGVEEQFYIFWPVLLLCAHRLVKRRWAAPAVIAVVAAASFYLSLHHLSTHRTGIYYLVQYRAFEFCIGAAVLWLPRLEVTRKRWTLEILCALGFVLTVIALVTYNESTVFPSYNAILPAVGAALLIYAGEAKWSGALLRCRPAVYVGLVSYSLYLVHWPLIVFVKTFNENMDGTYALHEWQPTGIFVAAILIASLMHKYIEQPARHMRTSMKRSQAMFAGGWIAALGCIGALGVSVYLSTGWLWRVDLPIALRNTASINEFSTKYWGGAGFEGGLIHQGKDAAPNIVIMGDSHAGMLFTGMVNELAKPFDLTVFSATGGGGGKFDSALLLPGTTRLAENQPSFDASTRNANAEVLQQLARSSSSVFIYSAAYTGQLPEAADLVTHKAWDIRPDRDLESSKYAPFVAALERMRIALDGRKFIIVGDVPGSSKYRVLSCIAHLKWFPRPLCLPEQSRLEHQAALNVNKVLRAYAETHRGVFFIDPYDAFCNETTCRNVDSDGMPLYSDIHHLTQAGSELLFARISDHIMRIIGKQSVSANTETPRSTPMAN
ncbi:MULTISPECIES: acyltransferase family protein [Pandoraea]|uniref:acyltransferase family protein n=1 Tax=Pandoraea TaxID=93217 RepID=UPI001F5D49DD|nr:MULTISPECIES: acyltransferase family protein [Pandoraea]MCI3205730.1 hypothetical protein [Pandoraea sp. LA3]MDN4583758.1 hypothetical protein [Pandoraea capi]